MSVYRPKKSPYYHFDFSIDRYRFSGSTKLRDERDAQAFEDAQREEAQALVDRLNSEGRGPLRLKPACERWWNEHGQHLADQKIKSVLDRIVEILGAKTYLHAITDDDVAQLIETRRQDRRRDSTVLIKGKPKILYRLITPTTVNRTLDLLRRVMRRAKENWNAAIIREPVWKKHRLKQKKRPVREILPSEERRIDQVESLDYAELRQFAIITGLRRKNLFLTKPQVSFELATMTIITKGGVPRIIPLSREAYAILWRRRGHHPVYFFTAVCTKKWRNPHNPKDVREIGKRYPITPEGFSSHKDRAWSKAGVDARIHDLRHTTGMRTLRATGNLRIVQDLLGHSTIAITSEFYTGATVEDVREAMERTAEAQRHQRELLEQLEQHAPKAIEGKGGDE
ncbi:integrase [Bradyrhizobium sp. USDA 3240]